MGQFIQLPGSRRFDEMLLLILFGLVLTSLVGAEVPSSRVVRTTQGLVRGYKEPNDNFFAFYGIPYATAPTGSSKFKAPLPPPAWVDTFEATNKATICPQSKWLVQMLGADNSYTMEEDCLLINVFVPETDATDLPVVVYVHGGAFQCGFASFSDQKPLSRTGKMIVVNFNYRLGANGFLCLGTEDVPGNAGMKDQVAALRWVKRNIANFGGNPEDVTLAGASAGAAAVEILLLSKSTHGLFNKVIPESGAAVGVWAIQNDPLAIAKLYARSQHFQNVDDVYALEEFYKNIPLDVLQADAFVEGRDSTFMFVPCVERKGSNDAFLTDAPIEILKSGDYDKLPLLTGFADMEGIFRLPLLEKWKDDMTKKFSEFLPADLTFANDEERQRVAEKVKKFYFGERPIDGESALGYVDYFSDVLFAYPTHRSVTLQAEAGSTKLYWYQYAFVETGHTLPYPGVTGANHCAQSLALADLDIAMPLYNKQKTEDYKKIQELLKDVWTNFIITGQPAPKGTLAEKALGGEWPVTSPASPHYVLFNRTSEIRGEMLPKRMRFWDEIYNEYYRTPIPPPEPPKREKTEL